LPTPGLIPIPEVPANPTPEQLQSAITAILNNLNYLQGQLSLLQPFDQDLFYGLWNNAGVRRLQQFLTDKGYMVGLATGNYYTKTLAAVKAYQTAKGITPVSGYFGPKTRQAANQDLGL
jgi:peptidoglycan hydrolase-like protein with peptidoglycan-binding domain